MRQMRLALSCAILGYHYAAWRHPDVPANGDHDIDHFIRCAAIAERGKLDFLFFADIAGVRNMDDPRIRRDLEQSHIKPEPTLLCAALAATTRHVGLVPTISTSFHHPTNVARRLASIDHISDGRMGWNLVTSTSPDEARNYGQDRPLTSEQRHARAREFLGVMHGLWDSWDDDAFLRDKATGQYFDPAKFHRLDHVGTHFKVRGPLDTARPPQGALPLITAGESANSQDLAAEVADMVYAAQPTLALAQTYYAGLKGRMAAYGRRPESLLMMTGIMPFIGRTQAEAQAKFDQVQALLDPRVSHGMLIINHFPDLSAHGLDDPVPDLTMQALHSTVGRPPEFTEGLMARARRERMTLRQLFAAVSAGFWHLGVIGTPQSIADTMEQWFEEGAADGFIIQPPYLPGSAEDFVNEVVPELQRRSLFRTEYEGTTLRDNLGLSWIPSRYADRGAMRSALPPPPGGAWTAERAKRGGGGREALSFQHGVPR